LLTEKGDNSLEYPNLDFCKMTPVSSFGTKKKAGLYINDGPAIWEPILEIDD
jgi:hypothetical protein